MKTHVFSLLLLVTLLVCMSVLPENACAAGYGDGEFYTDLGLRTGYLRGNTTYHISYYTGASGIESELEFPLQTFLLGFEGRVGYKNSLGKDVFGLNVKWLTNIDDGSGKMKDSDWLTDDLDIIEVGSSHPGKDIYSESDMELDAKILDLNAAYKFWLSDKFNIGPMIGYKYQRFEYDVSNVNQVGYGPYAPFYTATVSGKVLDYKVSYNIPYFGLSSELLFKDKFHANIKLAYSPFVSAKDTDDHILRYKLSKGDTKGHAAAASLNAIWEFLPMWFLNMGGEYMNIHTTGTQHQYFYAGPYMGYSADVNDKITSEQWLVKLGVIYRFY